MTDVGALEIVAIGKGHRREAFDCGEAALNDYLRRYARQNHERNLARSFVAVDAGKRVLGYYSLASAAVEFESLPPDYAKRLPRYPVPAVRIARLAVDRAMQGKGLGERLLADALKRILASAGAIGIKVVLVDAKSEGARAFYRRYGFLELADDPMTLFLPVETIGKALPGSTG